LVVFLGIVTWTSKERKEQNEIYQALPKEKTDFLLRKGIFSKEEYVRFSTSSFGVLACCSG